MALTIRPDAALRGQLDAIARAQGQSVNQYLLGLIRADVSRRQRLANAVGLSWRATDAEIADALGAAVAAPLSDIEQSHLPAEPAAAIAYVAGRAARKSSSRPAPMPVTAKRNAAPRQETEREELERLRREHAQQTPQAWRDSVRASLASGPVRVTGATLELRSTPVDSLPTEFRLFTKGENQSTAGSVLFDARAAKLVLEQWARHGVDGMIDVEHRSLFGVDETSRDAVGWFKPELRKGELWATSVTWTQDGTERLRSRRQRYTSPAFFCAEFDDKTQLPRVTSLVNCAICSMPATYQIAPLVASARGGK